MGDGAKMKIFINGREYATFEGTPELVGEQIRAVLIEHGIDPNVGYWKRDDDREAVLSIPITGTLYLSDEHEPTDRALWCWFLSVELAVAWYKKHVPGMVSVVIASRDALIDALDHQWKETP